MSKLKEGVTHYGKWDKYDEERIAEYYPEYRKNFSKIAPNDQDIAKEIFQMIQDGRLYIMDKESMVPFEASCVIGYKTENGKVGLLIGHER